MAPLVTPQVIEIYIWNHLQAVVDGMPAVGAKLYTFAAATSTPKAAYTDRWLTVAHSNPIMLNDQGAADVYLDGYYNLRLTDADNILLWSIDNFTFDSSAPPPAPGDTIVGSSDTDIVSSPGAGVISVPGLVPAGFRCEGLTWTITTAFGTSGGLTGLLIGDAVANDRWARLTDLSAGQTGGQVSFRSDTTPVEPIPYTILVAAEGGLLDATGGLHLTAYYSVLPADTP